MWAMTVTKWLIWSISLLLLSCGEEEMAKPSLRGIWARGGTKVDVTSMADTGFAKTALEYAKLNGILYQQGEWADFVDRAFGKTYYVESTSGSDVTGDGTALAPFQSIKKAADSVENGGYGDLVLAEAGDYPVGEDITLINKFIRITEASTTNTKIVFESYTDTGKNNLYKFVLINSGLFVIVNNIEIDAPDNAGNDWENTSSGVGFASAIMSAQGLNYVYFYANTAVTFSATPATGGYPCLAFQSFGSVLNLSGGGTVTTNDQGYLLGYVSGLTPLTIVSNISSTIDNPLFRVLNGATATTQILTTGVFDAMTSDADTVIRIDETTTAQTIAIDSDEPNADIKAVVEAMILRNTGITATVTATTTRNGSDKITSITLEIAGFSGFNIPFPMYMHGTDFDFSRYFYTTQNAKPYGHNIVTN
jgi:hypothetical protein